MVVKGRRWRKTDPELSPAMVEELKHHLGVARNGVRAAKRSGSDDDLKDARGRVDAAKHGLGERGDYWWEMTVVERREQSDSSAYAVQFEPSTSVLSRSRSSEKKVSGSPRQPARSSSSSRIFPRRYSTSTTTGDRLAAARAVSSSISFRCTAVNGTSNVSRPRDQAGLALTEVPCEMSQRLHDLEPRSLPTT